MYYYIIDIVNINILSLNFLPKIESEIRNNSAELCNECKNCLPVEFICKNIGDSMSLEQLLTKYALSQLAQLFVQVEVRNGSSEHCRCVGVYINSAGTVEQGGLGLGG